jgi:hypothetical protein
MDARQIAPSWNTVIPNKKWCEVCRTGACYANHALQPPPCMCVAREANSRLTGGNLSSDAKETPTGHPPG